MTKKKITGFEALAQSGLATSEKLMMVRKSKSSFFIGLPREIAMQENRIILTPEAVSVLVANGHHIIVEKKAGLGCKFTDQQYSEAGAQIVDTPEEVYKADVILKIEPPTKEELAFFRPNQVLISAIQMGNLSKEYLHMMSRKKITALGFEFIEDKQGGMPIVRAMSEIAGNTAILIAAEYLSKAHGGKGVMLGGIAGVPPIKVVILGAGTVAEYAARAALSMGAEIQVFDNHIYKLHRLRQMLGQPFYSSTIDTYHLSNSLRTADVVIGALRGDRGRVRHVINEEMVKSMRTDSVVIDLCIDQGGCVSTSKLTNHANPIFRKFGVIHYCVPNVASRVARTATIALSNIFTPTILRVAEKGSLDNMLIYNHWFMKGVYLYRGHLTNEIIADRLHVKHKNIELLLAGRV